MKTKKKIVIFGATGNVGAYLVDYALKHFNLDEYEIIASGRRDTDFFYNKGVKYYSVDITVEEDLEKLPKDGIYAVLLLAAQIPSYMDEYKPKKYLDSIVLGAFNVLEYCRKHKADRIIFTQTVFDVSLYPHEEIIKPYMAPNFSYSGDHAVYVVAKNAALGLLEHYRLDYGLKKFVFRLPTIYGYSPYPFYFSNNQKKMRPIYIMIDRAINSKDIEIWGDPKYAKDMVHVDDFNQMVCKAVEVDRNEGTYNVGTGVPVSLEEQIRTLVDVFSPRSHPSKITYQPAKVSDGGFLMDISNAIDELGYSPKYNCRQLFEDYKKEMGRERFKGLR